MSDIELIKKYVSADLHEEAIKKLNDGYPVQYIIGNVDFYNCIINVNENVLIPRFETEYLVEKVLKYVKKMNIQEPNILEVGTGSGCISIAIKKEIKSNIIAIDISKKAIEVAQINAKNNNVDITFISEDVHHYDTLNKFDLIISNPPYVPYDSEVDEKIKYEPQNAIFALNNGIYFYDLILKKFKKNLGDSYLIAFEIGDKQGYLIENLAHQHLENAYVQIEKDYNDFERYVFITNNEEIFK